MHKIDYISTILSLSFSTIEMTVQEMDTPEHIEVLHMMYAICFTHIGKLPGYLKLCRYSQIEENLSEQEL